MDLTEIFKDADNVTITGTTNNSKRLGIYVRASKGFTSGVYFVGENLVTNKLITELVS